VARSVLLLAVYEIKYAEDVPVPVAINEAVELSKKFDEPDSSSFVNGVLAGVVK
jgi:N utilization substance protein B